MSNGFFTRVVIASLLGLVGMSVACDKSPAGPTPTVAATALLSVTAISPAVGLKWETVRVTGTGFLAGATLTLGGVAANVTSVMGTVISATAPVHAAGTVDVVVTNPGGESGTLTRGYTYEVVTLTASPNQVAPGGQLSVSWVAPGRRSILDWIAFLKVGDPSTNYEEGWWQYTKGATSGTLTFSAPTQPGEYEFRYLLDDDFTDVARSSPVTVSALTSPLVQLK